VAKTTTWTGDVDGDWDVAGNWDNGVPATGDTVIINQDTAEEVWDDGPDAEVQIANLTYIDSGARGGPDNTNVVVTGTCTCNGCTWLSTEMYGSSEYCVALAATLTLLHLVDADMIWIDPTGDSAPPAGSILLIDGVANDTDIGAYSSYYGSNAIAAQVIANLDADSYFEGSFSGPVELHSTGTVILDYNYGLVSAEPIKVFCDIQSDLWGYNVYTLEMMKPGFSADIYGLATISGDSLALPIARRVGHSL